MGFQKYLKEAWKHKEKYGLNEVWKERIRKWGKEPVIQRIDKPTRIDRAKELGYKAKKGFVIVRTRIKKGRSKRKRVHKARKPRKQTIDLYPKKSKQVIAEQRVQKKFPNLEVLASYYVGESGTHKFFEVLLVDPNSPSIQKDPNLSWICEPQHRKRVMRGLTPAGKKSRGL